MLNALTTMKKTIPLSLSSVSFWLNNLSVGFWSSWQMWKCPIVEDSGKQEGKVSRDYWCQISNTTSTFCFECELPESSESLGPVVKPLRHHTFKLSRTKSKQDTKHLYLEWKKKKNNKKEKLMKKISHDALVKPSWESCIITPDSSNPSIPLETMNICSHCHFLLFKIYWSRFFKASPFI